MKNFLFVSLLCLSACWTDNNEAKRALDDQGFTKVTITDSSAFWAHFHGCGQDDGHWYEATATNPVGKQVVMMVCCGSNFSFKGCVVRSK